MFLLQVLSHHLGHLVRAKAQQCQVNVVWDDVRKKAHTLVYGMTGSVMRYFHTIELVAPTWPSHAYIQ